MARLVALRKGEAGRAGLAAFSIAPTIRRCRVWCVRPAVDVEFRKLVAAWYAKRESGEIKSTNFQLHPPRNEDHNIIRNSLGNLEYPLFFQAERDGDKYHLVHFDEAALLSGRCRRVDD